VEDSDERGRVAFRTQCRGEVTLIGMKIPAELTVRETHDAIAVRIASGEDRRTRRAALRGGRKRAGEPHAFSRQAIQIRRFHGCYPVAAKIASQIVARDQHIVVFSCIRIASTQFGGSVLSIGSCPLVMVLGAAQEPYAQSQQPGSEHDRADERQVDDSIRFGGVRRKNGEEERHREQDRRGRH
jgi:hypothetical protein